MSNKWIFTKAEPLSLARLVTTEAADGFNPDENPTDTIAGKDGVRRLLEKVYADLRKRQIDYDLPVYDGEVATQQVRTPLEIMVQPRRGTCLELALLLSGICESYRLIPCIVIVEGHAFAAVSLTHLMDQWSHVGRAGRMWGADAESNGALTDKGKLQKAIEENEAIAIECTGFAKSTTLSKEFPEGRLRDQSGFLSFEDAVTAGLEHLRGYGPKTRSFRFAVDIGVARYKWKCKPFSQNHFDLNVWLAEIGKRLRRLVQRYRRATITVFAATLLLCGLALSCCWYFDWRRHQPVAVEFDKLAAVLEKCEGNGELRLGQKVTFEGVVKDWQAPAIPPHVKIGTPNVGGTGHECCVFLKNRIEDSRPQPYGKIVSVTGVIANSRRFPCNEEWSISDAEIELKQQ